MYTKGLELLHKYWSSHAIITYPQEGMEDYSNVWMRFHANESSDIELLQGELKAMFFHVGCYVVRMAQRLYCRYDLGYYAPDKEVPANPSPEEMEMLKGEFPHWDRIKYRGVIEVMAKHIDDPNHEFVYICRAAEGLAWSESITDIFTAKENPDIPDNYASLFVCHSWSGSSFGRRTWYILAPTGKIIEKDLGIG